MKGKQILALTLSAAMVVGSSLTVFAEDQKGSDQGTGEIQYVETGDVFNVVLPTDAGTTFDYLLDPDGLIAKTGGSRYSGKTFDDGKTVYFLHASKVDGTIGGTAGTSNCDYSDTSDEIKVINKSTGAVDLTVTAKIAEADGVKMDADGTFNGAEAGNLYLALVGNNGTADEKKAIDTAGVELTANIEADNNAYETAWEVDSEDATKGKYVKKLTTAAQAADYTGFKTYTFKLTGACKANDTALTALKENAPKIDLTWSVKDFTENSVLTLENGVLTAKINVADFKNGTLKIGDTVGALNTQAGTWGGEDGAVTFTFNSTWANAIKGQTCVVTVNLKDDTSYTASFDVPN